MLLRLLHEIQKTKADAWVKPGVRFFCFWRLGFYSIRVRGDLKELLHGPLACEKQAKGPVYALLSHAANGDSLKGAKHGYHLVGVTTVYNHLVFHF